MSVVFLPREPKPAEDVGRWKFREVRSCSEDLFVELMKLDGIVATVATEHHEILTHNTAEEDVTGRAECTVGLHLRRTSSP